MATPMKANTAPLGPTSLPQSGAIKPIVAKIASLPDAADALAFAG
jgi:hypothetical protein